MRLPEGQGLSEKTQISIRIVNTIRNHPRSCRGSSAWESARPIVFAVGAKLKTELSPVQTRPSAPQADPGHIKSHVSLFQASFRLLKSPRAFYLADELNFTPARSCLVNCFCRFGYMVVFELDGLGVDQNTLNVSTAS